MTEPVYFRLTQDVVNPQPDRRSRDWHKQPVFVKGQVFKLVGDRLRLEGGWKGIHNFKYALWLGTDISQHGDYAKLFEALMEAPSESVKQDAVQWLRDKSVWTDQVLAKLIDLGKVTKADVLDLQAVLENDV